MNSTVQHVLPSRSASQGSKQNAGWEAVLAEMRERRLVKRGEGGATPTEKGLRTKRGGSANRRVERLRLYRTAKKLKTNTSTSTSTSVSMVMDELGSKLKALRTDVKRRGDRPD